jgi:hypothetical protein
MLQGPGGPVSVHHVKNSQVEGIPREKKPQLRLMMPRIDEEVSRWPFNATRSE